MRSLIIILLLIVFASCNAPEHSFSPEELRSIDSLYLLQKDTFGVEIDLVCDSIFEKTFDATVDSLDKVREKEILDILGK